jgi:hypothetical protein
VAERGVVLCVFFCIAGVLNSKLSKLGATAFWMAQLADCVDENASKQNQVG